MPIHNSTSDGLDTKEEFIDSTKVPSSTESDGFITGTESVEDLVSHIIEAVVDGEDDQKTFDIYQVRSTKSIASIASSDAGDLNALSDCDSSDFEQVKSDEDSDVEFERYLSQTARVRNKIFTKEHGWTSELPKRAKTVRRTKDVPIEDEYENLPALEKLSIQCEDSTKLEKLGQVESIVGCIAVVSTSSSITLDLDSIVFDKERNALGAIFDVFGAVRSPSYCIRFNSHTEASTLPLGLEVYYAPTNESYTKPILQKQLQGPWKRVDRQTMESEDDEDDIVFSDDEKEKEFRAKKKAARIAASKDREQGAGAGPRKRNSNRVQFNVEGEQSTQRRQQPPNRGNGRGRGRGQERGAGGGNRGGQRGNSRRGGSFRGNGPPGGNGWNWNQPGSFQNYQASAQNWSQPAAPTWNTAAPQQQQPPMPAVTSQPSSDNPYAEFLGYGSP